MTLEEDWAMMDALLGSRLVGDFDPPLSPFQQRFIADNDAKYEELGDTLSLSPKQWQIINSVKWKTCDRRAVQENRLP